MLGTDLCQELISDCAIYELDIFDRRRGCLPVRRSFSEGGNLPYVNKKAQKYIKCDITDKKSISKAILEIKPDIVIHSAAYTDVDGCELNKARAYKVNSEATQNVASACKESGLALIYISTDFVFDGKKRSPYTEEDKTGPLSIYGDSKLKGEAAVSQALEKYFILRTSWLYGRYGKNFVDTILAKAKTEKVLKVVDDQAGSPTYTKDLAIAIHKLLNIFFTQYAQHNTQYGTYHVSNSGSVSWYEYAKEIVKLAGLKAGVVPISSEELARPARRPAMSILDNSKFIRLTGYEMRGWESALKDYLS